MSGAAQPPSPSGASLQVQVDPSDGQVRVQIAGDIDENANLLERLDGLAGAVHIDLGGVRRINSAGVREWVNFLRELEARAVSVTLSRCSAPIVMQMNMISNFRGAARVASLFAPMVCPSCDREDDLLVSLTPEVLAGLPDQLPAARCPDCGADMELDDIPERYFAFLNLAGAP